MRTRAWVGATLLVAAFATAPTGLAQGNNGEQCPARDGYGIVIHAGDIDCVTAADFAVQYDVNGDKYQTIGPFTCYSATAATAPLLFQCVADTEDRAEFAVYPA
ncbi:hypothetical protein [Mycolicibacterium sp. XJ879]